MGTSQTLKEIADLIKSKKTFLVVSHYNPDADAYGSSCAITLALNSIGKKAVCVNETELSSRYKFIPGAADVLGKIPAGEYEAAIVCDCGTLTRAGDSLREDILKIGLVINIDHHISNDYFGQYNYVDAQSSSTSEIIFDLLQVMQIKPTKDIASAIFVGISGDTGSFRYSCTSAKTFKVAEELVKSGASPSELSSQQYGNSPLSAVKLQSDALCNMQIHFGGKVAEVIVTNEMYKKFKAGAEDTEALVERARDIEGVCISALIKEDAGIWRISLRSVDSKYNVSDLAAEFGGGGHKVAAAFRWRKSLDELRAELLPKLEALVAKE